MNIFLGIACLFLLGLFYWRFKSKKQNKQNGSSYYVYILLLCILGCLGIGIFAFCYMYPKDKNVFSNVDYHVLRHKGYEFGKADTFYLVRNDAPDDMLPELSLWDTKEGVAAISGGSIHLRNYSEPFYIEDTPNRHKKSQFVLANRTVMTDASEGFSIERGGKTLFKLEIIDNGDRCYYVSHIDSNADTSAFTRRINVGFPLMSILHQTPRLDLPEFIRSYLDGVYLCRNSLEITDNRCGDFKTGERNTSDLVVMPSTAMLLDGEVRISGKDIVAPTFDISYHDDFLFFSGVSLRPECYAIRVGEDDVRIEYIMSHMFHLNDSTESGRMFLTSSIKKAVESGLDGGFYYGQFDTDSNIYHINGEIRYKAGSARDSMRFDVIDFESHGENNVCVVNAGEEFYLSTQDTVNNVRWIFDVEDLRATNDFQLLDFALFVMFFIFFVSLRILLAKMFRPDTLSYTELSAYVVVLSFCVVRLMLGWRISTFVPIEGLGGRLFAIMRSNVVVKTGIIACCFPIAAIVVSFIKISHEKLRIQNISSLGLCCLYLLALIICICFGYLKIITPRLFNIPLPTLLYLLFDYWLVSRIHEEKGGVNIVGNGGSDVWHRLLLAILTMVYFAIADAGFVIVFIVFLIILHFVLSPIWNDNIFSCVFGSDWDNKRGKMVWRILVPVVGIVLCVLLLAHQGQLMIIVLRNIRWILILGCITLVFLACKVSTKRVSPKAPGLVRKVIPCVALVALGIVLGTNVSDRILDKAVHMRYRAEIQRLDQNEGVEDIINHCDYNSADVTHIMQAAHNQWFINQYLSEMESNRPTYFTLRPHSNQGSSFSTQTTDLVVTRYLLSEHGGWPLGLLISLLVMVLAMYVFEVDLRNWHGKTFLGALVLLVSISLVVGLSATNKAVFIGQDFPFISVQSIVAVLFPILLLLLIVAYSIINMPKMKAPNYSEDQDTASKRLLMVIFIVILVAASFVFIPRKGTKQLQSQFDVTKVVDNVSAIVSDIDADFRAFQENNRSKVDSCTVDSLWHSFRSTQYATTFQHKLDDNDSCNRFVQSLFRYFDSVQDDKTDVEELMHLRKHDNYWHIAVNKQHFSMPSKLFEALEWSGDLLAAKKAIKYSLNDMSNNQTFAVIENENNSPQDLFPDANLHLWRFGTGWTPDRKPLLIVSADVASDKVYNHSFKIQWADTDMVGHHVWNGTIVPTRLMPGDLLSVFDASKSKSAVRMYHFTQDADNYLAKNIKLNGHQRLFYPLGPQSMWSCQFAKLVSSVCALVPQYRDSSIRVSIDYDLYKNFYHIISEDNKYAYLSSNMVVRLWKFYDLKDVDKTKKSNGTGFYLEDRELRSSLKDNQEAERAVAAVNSIMSKDKVFDVRTAISRLTVRNYDFAAVAIDGNGRIRLLFDYSKYRRIDPNDSRQYNRFLKDMYSDGTNETERDLLGNKALQLLPSGPGSTFKPIVYTAVTSQCGTMNWTSLSVTDAGLAEAKAKDTNENAKFDYYGGAKLPYPLSINYNDGRESSNYITYSNNLYHSLVVLFGLQKKEDVKNIMRNSNTSTAYDFPVFRYDGERKSFDVEKWYQNNEIRSNGCILNVGLRENFCLDQETPLGDNCYSDYYSNDSTGFFGLLWRKSRLYRSYTYAEKGSANVYDRQDIRKGFNQLFLGADPFKVSPLQLATMAMRLASYNSSPRITTLEDDGNCLNNFKPLKEDKDWNNQYFPFFKKYVLGQMRQVPKVGTASALKSTVEQIERQGYYVYVKTGTLNDVRTGSSKSDRIKNLMVIISDKELESAANVDDLRKAKYYVLYMSYIGVEDDRFNRFSTYRFARMIKATVNSELFKEYMKGGE